MTNTTDKDSKCTPETAFLENNPTISPADMNDCILDRTIAILDCLLTELLESGSKPPPTETICSILGQVEGNLQLLTRINRVWAKGESRAQKLHPECGTFLHCETEGLLD